MMTCHVSLVEDVKNELLLDFTEKELRYRLLRISYFHGRGRVIVRIHLLFITCRLTKNNVS